MRRMLFYAIPHPGSLHETLIPVLITAAACANAPNPMADLKAEEQAIRELDVEWAAAATRKDVSAAVSYYAPD